MQFSKCIFIDIKRCAIITCATVILYGCGSDSDTEGTDITQNDIDSQLRTLITDNQLDISLLESRSLPVISDPLPQLGKKLFFSKSLGGQFDSACASCHHPMLGGADNLSLPIGIEADDPTLLGLGRENATGVPVIGRHSPTVFNTGLWDKGMFWDSRVEIIGESLGNNGEGNQISTPDSGFGVVDSSAGANLAEAQSRFPVTSVEEMKGEVFEDGSEHNAIRDHLAARLGDYGVGTGELSLNQWLADFQTAFDSSDDASTLITYSNIARALAEYERSMLFIDSPWQNYIDGDETALTEQQKRGALLFFTSTQDDGAGCSGCHSGSKFSDERHHTVGFPQIGPGKGDGDNSDDDFGREHVSDDTDDRYRFRTPSLLNISATAPYGHTGAYLSLADVVRHYINPRRSIDDYFTEQAWCDLPQFENVSSCTSLYPNAHKNTILALNKLGQEQRNDTSELPNIQLNDNEVLAIVAFLESLTDPCVEDRVCMVDWIADETTDNPDGEVLIAIDTNGTAL
ncbi:cytochrome C peroxidase [Photobacterium makurazakiensis]|uniref:cytochrome-c peroxidase n=1 Tax=Photobacterium makurazakiensis TaxID=2910234 RepID=UPI003D12A51F